MRASGVLRHKMHSISLAASQPHRKVTLRDTPALGESLTLPSFLGIGFPKAGTTWLYENLRAHPDVFVGFDSGRGVLDAAHRNSPGFLPTRVRVVLTRMYLDDSEALGRNHGVPAYQ
jgi:hypothetical protein